MPELILIRHSVSQPTPETSAHPWSLTDTGRARCEKLADYLMFYQPHIIYSSNEPKARITADLVAERLMIPSAIAPGLHETRRENVPFFDEVSEWQQALLTGFEQPHQVVFGEESFADACERFGNQIDTLIAAHPEKTIAAVTHGTVMSLYLAELIMTNEAEAATGFSKMDTARAFWDGWGMPGYVVLSLPEMQVVELVPGITEN